MIGIVLGTGDKTEKKRIQKVPAHSLVLTIKGTGDNKQMKI